MHQTIFDVVEASKLHLSSHSRNEEDLLAFFLVEVLSSFYELSSILGQPYINPALSEERRKRRLNLGLEQSVSTTKCG